jgi:solute carrier family 32 (vesicular inhibitory amino acid transporter)
MAGGPWYTLEDAKASFNLFCVVYGIGTLGMPANFSRAGPYIATVGIVFMAFANIYAAIVCSKTMLAAPKSVRTYGDLGEWVLGRSGRWIVIVAQMGVILLMPCAYLVLGGTILPSLFPDALKDTTWIILMALSLLPVSLIPTLKEGAGAAFAGCVGTIIADVLALGVLLHGMDGHPSVPKPDISFEQVATTFGNFCLAYGAAVVIPALQRQHSQPERMPRVIGVTLTFASVLFLVLAGTGYSAVGCQISGNLLFTIYPNAATGLTKLGFSPDKGMVVLAYLFMQLHITIAFSVILHPAFFIFERMLLGMHARKSDDLNLDPALDYAGTETPIGLEEQELKQLPPRVSKGSVVSVADIEKDHETEADEARNYDGRALQYIPLRLAVITVMTLVSIALKDHFLDLTDFMGASTMSFSCIILPIVFYFKKLWPQVPVWERIVGSFIVVLCVVIGTYVTIQSGKKLFNPNPALPTDPNFPFCHAEFEFDVYYDKTLVHGRGK